MRRSQAAAVGLLLVALAGCSHGTQSDGCDQVHATVAAQIAAGEAKAAEASALAASTQEAAVGSPERTKFNALMHESAVHEIPAYARLVAAGDCYSGDEIADARDRLDVLASNFSKYAGS